MKGCSVRAGGLALGVAAWLIYASLELRHFYDVALRVPPTQRVRREVAELRLPRLYLCPADRGRSEGFQWHSFECLLTYKADHTTCPARLQKYEGRTPERFTGHKGGADGGECLEFGTHMIGVREEYSAAWNEITMRASFRPARAVGAANALQEVELGYLPAEWVIGSREATVERSYYPLLRVPVFFLDTGSQGFGVATRAYLAKEVDRGRRYAGRYWYTYSAMQLAVENATMPPQSFVGAGLRPEGRVGVVHVVITLEDFEEYDFQVISPFFPFLGVLGQVAGIGALLWLLMDLRQRGGRAAKVSGLEGGSNGFSSSYGEVSTREPAEEEEAEALLGTEAPRKDRASRGEEASSGQALLGGEPGGDGL